MVFNVHSVHKGLFCWYVDSFLLSISRSIWIVIFPTWKDGSHNLRSSVFVVSEQIQIWLAMAYEAHNRHDDCIALYKRLESGHPNKNIKRQAADLRYILEAPKLKISKDEMVSIPIIDKDYDRWVIVHHCLLDVSDCGGTTCWTASVTWSCFIHLIFLCGTTIWVVFSLLNHC